MPEIVEKPGCVEISGISDFSPELIFNCGQNFRFSRMEDGSYLGCAFGRPLRVRTHLGRIVLSCAPEEFNSIWRGYFDLDRDYAAVRTMTTDDPFLSAAAEFGKGIRILRQEPFETLITFLISQCNNIKRITGIITRLCEQFGERVECFSQTLYTFPEPARLAVLDDDGLLGIRAGYRAAYILKAARKVAEGYDLWGLSRLPSCEIREELLSFPGVGRKVADCVMLFGYARTEAFPVDVWISKALRKRYGAGFDFERFAEVSGILQQYIFHYVRSCPEALSPV